MADYYVHGSFPAAGASGSSASMRAEFDSITAAFNKLPVITGMASKLVRINDAGTVVESSNVAVVNPATPATLQLAAGSTLATAGAFSQTLTATAPTTVTLPVTGTLATLAGAETLTNKTLTNPVLTNPLTVANGGTGVATLAGLAFGNGTGAMTAATAAQIVAAIGATAVANATSATSATSATNVAGGAAGSLSYQSAPSTTAMLAAGTAGQVLTMGATTPQWSNALAADNPVINGAMLVDQVNAGAAATVAITTVTYLTDMFYGFTAGATVQAQQVAGGGEFAKALQFTGAAGVTGITSGTRIESVNAARFTNKTVTAKVRMSDSLLTSCSWAVYSANVADVFSAKTLVASGSFTISAVDTDYTFSFAAGANAGNGLSVEFSVGAQTSGTWKMTGIDLVEGSVSRPFPHTDYASELARCQRYYEKIGGEVNQDFWATANGTVAGFQFGHAIYFKVKKRVAPTVTKVGTLTVTNCAQPGLSSPSTNHVMLTSTTSAAGAASFYGSATPNTTYITADARL